VNRSVELVERINALFEESTSPCPVEPRADMLQQLADLHAGMTPEESKDFEEYVAWFGVFRQGLSGTTDEILRHLHPWALQLIVQKYRGASV